MDEVAEKMNEVLTVIAKKHLYIPTLEVRNSDRLDFHECGVASIKAALEEAFRAGFAVGQLSK